MRKRILYLIVALCAPLFGPSVEFCLAQTASEMLELASDLAEQGQYAQAETIYSSIIADFPASEAAQLAQVELGLLYTEQDKPAEAKAVLESLLGQFSEKKTTPQFVLRTARLCSGLDRHNDALGLFTYCVEHWPDSNQAALAQSGVAISYISLGNQSAAREAISELLTRYSQSPDLPAALGDIAERYRDCRMYEEALKYHKYCLSRWSGDRDNVFWSLQGVAISNVMLGNFADAEAALTTLLAQFVDYNDIAPAVLVVADAYYESGKAAKALELHRFALDHWPDADCSVWTYSGLARAQIVLGRDADAQTTIAAMLSKCAAHPDLPAAVLEVAEQYHKNALAAEANALDATAAAALRRAVELYQVVADDFPPSADITPTACSLAGDCFRKLGDYQKSAAYYQKLADQYPQHDMAWHALFMVGRNHEYLAESASLPPSEAFSKTETAYKQLLEKHPNCKAARIASVWLSRHPGK